MEMEQQRKAKNIPEGKIKKEKPGIIKIVEIVENFYIDL